MEAKDQVKTRSEQYRDEWELYYATLKENGLDRPGYFYEVRGNHDAFNVVSLTSEANYFANYSNTRVPSYSFVKETSFGKYSFVAIDAW